MRKLFLLPLLALALACSDNAPVAPDLADSPEMAVAQAKGGMDDVVKMVPLKWKGTWWIGSGDPTVCDEYKDEYPKVLASFPVWEGTGTHFGRFTASTTNCVDGASWELLSHSSEIVAANGDMAYVYGEKGDGTVMVIDWADPDWSFEIVGPQFVGGTGRFENASGSYHLHAESLRGGDYYIVGEISAVGSSR